VDFGNNEIAVSRDDMPFGGLQASPVGATRPVAAELEGRVAAMIRGRRDRARFFPNRLFADPAWEILLALTLAEQQQARLSISHLCDRIDVPATTALRWIASLTDEGFLIRRDDPTDRRRKYIELSPSALANMVDYCLAMDGELRLAA
jgi:hypothetical protein